ncbi:DUF1540 domain-containing protein [Paenibacillus xerothermodurans]|uniref:DUF1540 domain-containing protein n=1 Tax=Paenibacillus xerothermodurans TaxID=1977292 RepID=A0A2W1NHR3_PAEXE|nr:DUF1540 domain-containing protein [Paenibacillus xerothermodurans]PZE22681.1 DUF1540 domain-containing protein [Paenibacillus xerothermodurans]
MTEVKCSVANCQYWAEGNNCAATAIIIDVDQHARANYDTEFAVEDMHGHKDAATSSSNTCCHTFTPRKS